MAEFSEVMEQFDRMCWHYRRKYECQACPMNGGNISQCQNIAFKEPKKTEETVMSWAEEHPLVYPTWADWFIQIGVAPCNQSCFHKWLLEYIPADIAEKLGIEPKEG